MAFLEFFNTAKKTESSEQKNMPETIKLGGVKYWDYINEIKKRGRIEIGTTDLLAKVKLEGDMQEVHPVERSARDLGFNERAPYEAICAKGIERGLKICPDRFALALRVAYTGQPEGEVLLIAMNPIKDDYNVGHFFAVTHFGGELSLSSGHAGPDGLCNPDDRFVFLK